MASRVVLVVVLLLSAMIPTPLLAGTEAIDPTPEAVAFEPEPLPSPSPTMTPTIESTPTPSPTAIIEPTATLAPTLEPTAIPTATLAPTATTEPTTFTEPTESATPEPTATPEPAAEVNATVDNLLTVLSAPDLSGISVSAAPTCTKVPLTGAGAGQDAVRFSCVSIQGQQNTQYQLVLTQLTGGWEYRFNSNLDAWTDDSPTGSLVTFTAQSSNFTFDLRPEVDNETPLGEATLSVSQTNGLGEPLLFTLESIDPEVDMPTCIPTVSAQALDFGTSEFIGSAWQTVTGNMTLTIDTTGPSCSGIDGGWDISVHSDGLSNGTGGAIGPDAITYLGGNGCEQEALAPAPGFTLSAEPQRIATTVGVAGGCTWSAPFQLQPEHSPAGAYQGQIHITMENGQ